MLKKITPLSLLFLFLTLAISAPCALAQATLGDYLPDGETYDPSVPQPADVIGHEVGEWHVTHDKLVYYMRALANASARVTIEEYASTYEGRPLILLTITSPENQADIASIKENQAALRNPERSGNLDLSELPVIVNLGYSVHGNEPSGSNASMVVAYHLAAAQSQEVLSLLENSVILIDPSLNPDGLNRFATWVNVHKSNTTVTDPNAREFNEVWPGGRTNHYWFDLNRDWLPVQHPSSRGRIQKFHEWKPNVLADFHEMGSNSTYFFQPGVPERTHPLTPEQNQNLTQAIAEYHADALDEIRELYYTGESYDDFYYGKGSTYPDIQGAVGILFEQASSRGHARENDYGIKTFAYTILNQVTTSLSTLKASLELKEELQEHMRGFFREAVQEARSSRVKGYVVGEADDLGRTWHLAEMLIPHSIEIYELTRDLEAGGTEFQEGKAFVIPAEQLQHKLITAMFERRTAFNDSLFYDVSAWTLPYAMNLPFAELEAGEFSSNLLGDLADDLQVPGGEVVGGRSNYSYLFEWNEYYAPRALYRLQKEGVRTTVASKPFQAITTSGIKDFDFGTIQVPIGIQDEAVTDENLFRIMNRIAANDGITVYSLDRGMTSRGIDLGSPSFQVLEKPSVAILGGEGMNGYEAGEAWHLFDRRFSIPATVMDHKNLSVADLDRYNVLVLVSGNYNALTNREIKKIKEWTDGGGTLIAIREAVRWANREGLTNLEFIEPEGQLEGPRRYVDISDYQGARGIGGSIFNGRLDLTHPLGYGYKDENIPLFRNSTIFMKKAQNPFATPVYYSSENPLAAGYISDENLERVQGSASVIVSRRGSGRVISMIDNPNFRAFWFGTQKLFMNAVFFGDTISPSSTN
ncbi:MAG: M14 family metallopeptidase [Balneolaceae bacterium]